MLFAPHGVRPSLAVSSQITIFRLIASAALVSTSARVLEDGEGWAGKAVNMYLIGGYPVASLTDYCKLIPRVANGHPNHSAAR